MGLKMADSGKQSSRPKRAHRVRDALPETIAPQLAVAVTRPPVRGEWSYEIKLDGYRFRARIEGKDVRLLTRNDQNWTRRLPGQSDALLELGVEDAWIDGEMVALDENGLPDFGALQRAMASHRTRDVVYFAFDLLFLNGRDLRALPQKARREMLSDLLERGDSSLLRFSSDFPHDANDILAAARTMHLEGVVGKRVDAPYTSGESQNWIKLKCLKRQEFVIGGYAPSGSRNMGVRKLLLGVHEGNRLVFSGTVALTGKTRHRAADEAVIMAARSADCPFADFPDSEKSASTQWLNPPLVAEVSFLEWTRNNVIRQGVYLGLRIDKPAASVIREVAVPPVEEGEKTTAQKGRGKVGVGNVAVTNADRIIDPSTSTTKLDLVQYYAAVAPWMLPHLKGRRVTLVRAPEGLSGELFFQKSAEGLALSGARRRTSVKSAESPHLLTIDSEASLIAAAQMGALEFHTGNATQPDLEHPDRMIFDLDPDVTLSWTKVVEAANLVKFILDELGLESWLKTSGGKGLHVVVPLAATQDWAQIKSFTQAVSQHLAKVLPNVFSAVSGPKNRVEKVYVDYLRNGRGQTTVAAYSVRARPGMGVSVPIDWDDLGGVKAADQFNVPSIMQGMKRRAGDPWAGYWTTPQVVTRQMQQALGPVRAR
jgi:bifunctional non-homologous end joining protein LigD